MKDVLVKSCGASQALHLTPITRNQMNIIYSEDQQPKLHLRVRAMLALHPHDAIGEAVIRSKEDLARELARNVLEHPDVFWEQSKKIAGYNMLEYGIDIFLITPDELRQIKKDSFRKGLEHAFGFRG